MFGKQLISECDAISEINGFIMLKYYLVWRKSENAFSNEAVNSVFYGVLIEEITESPFISGQDCVEGFSYDREEALNFIHMLSRNTVTPDSLAYIVDDYISDVGNGEGVSYNLAN